jgi:vitamin B12 transporter
VLPVLILFSFLPAEETNQITNQLQQEKVYTLPEIIVTANRYEEPQSESPSAVTVINENDIKKSGNKDVKELLKNIPGIELSQNGAFGGISQIYIRGTKPGSTLVMIDGVPVNDPISTDMSYDFSQLNSDNIERIEVLRGPYSTLYGSEAMGGVINIITKKGRGEPQSVIEVMAGSYNTFKYSGAVSGKLDKWDFSLLLSHAQGDGFSQVVLTNTSDDPAKHSFVNTTVSCKTGLILFPGANLNFTMRYFNSDTGIDYAANDPDINNNYYNENGSFKLEFSHAPNGFWDYNVSASYLFTRIDDLNYPDYLHSDLINSWYKGNDIRADLLNNFHPADFDTLTAGCGLNIESGSSHYNFDNNLFVSDISNISKTNTGVFIQNKIKLLDCFINDSSARADFSQGSATVLNYRTSGLFTLTNIGLSIKGNIGTGYKAPTLYQLYSAPYGSTNLKPEKSLGFDAGIVQSVFDGLLTIDAMYFQNQFNDMIDYYGTNDSSGYYTNIANALTRGLETSVKFSFTGRLSLQFDYTYTLALNTDTGKALPAIPAHKGGGTLELEPINNLFAGLKVYYTGTRTGFQDVVLQDYTKVDFNILYQMNKFDIYCNINNLLNAGYEEAAGYNNGGLTFNAGIGIKL